MKLTTLLTEEEKAKVQILAVSVDDHKISKKFAQSLNQKTSGGFDIPLLEDKNHRVINRYGIFNPDGRGWPHPATYVIDQDSVVRWKFVEVDYTQRARNEDILQALRDIGHNT